MEPERLSLARIPTPLQPIDGLLENKKLLIKRDDMTGIALTGNKIRKLEYLLYDAKNKGANRVITCGGIQSNHCRATAIAAAQLGMTSVLYLRTDTPPGNNERLTGNLRLSQMAGAEIRFITREQYKSRNEIMTAEAKANDYVIPEGGSNALGAWGYIRAVDEMMTQWNHAPTSIICATGSGGTLAGLSIGIKRRGLNIPVHGVCVCDDSIYFRHIVESISKDASQQWPELPQVHAHEVSVIEGYVGRGYALSTPEELKDITMLAQRAGLFFDPVYSGKAFRAMIYEPERFGDSPLFIHTGGIFGLLA